MDTTNIVGLRIQTRIIQGLISAIESEMWNLDKGPIANIYCISKNCYNIFDSIDAFIKTMNIISNTELQTIVEQNLSRKSIETIGENIKDILYFIELFDKEPLKMAAKIAPKIKAIQDCISHIHDKIDVVQEILKNTDIEEK